MDISDHPGVRRALEKDEIDVSHLLRFVLCSDTLEKVVLGLRGDDAERCMNIIFGVRSLKYLGR